MGNKIRFAGVWAGVVGLGHRRLAEIFGETPKRWTQKSE